MEEPLGRLRRKWEVNIRMDLCEIDWEGVDWMHLVQCSVSMEGGKFLD
jgi:hypothetical protein